MARESPLADGWAPLHRAMVAATHHIVTINCLKRLRFVPDIADDLRRLLEKLGDNYMAVHVRNTDYRTDYKRFFKSIEREVDDVDLLACSDDAKCVEFARGFFRRSRVFPYPHHTVGFTPQGS